MEKDTFSCLLISDFTIENFSRLLTNDQEFPQTIVTTAPYGQVFPVLLDDNHDCWNWDYDYCIVWTQPQGVIESFLNILNYQSMDLNVVFKQVDKYLSALSKRNEMARLQSCIWAGKTAWVLKR